MESKQTVQALKAHLALNVRNVEQSIEFYKKMLGIEPSKVRPGYAKFDVQNPPLNLTLNEGMFTERGALSHLGIQVGSTDDVLQTRQQWADAGLITRAKTGRTVSVNLSVVPMREAMEWLKRYERFWTVSIDRLAALVEEDGK